MRTLASAGASDLPDCPHYAGCVSLLCSAVTALIFRSLCCTANNRQTRQLSVEQLDYLLCCTPASSRSPWNSQPELKSAAFGCSLKHANIRRNSFLSVAMFIRCHGAQPDGGVVSRLSTFSTISAPVIHSCTVLDRILSAFVYLPRSVVTHVHLRTLTSHLSLSLRYNLRAKMPSVMNLTDGLELLSFRLTLTAH